MANFGEDYYSSFTVKNYNPGYFQLVCLPTFAGDKCQFSRAADCSGRGNPKDDGTCICDEDYSGSKCHKKKQDGLPVSPCIRALHVSVQTRVFLHYFQFASFGGVRVVDEVKQSLHRVCFGAFSRNVAL